jgi:hypothetical protein
LNPSEVYFCSCHIHFSPVFEYLRRHLMIRDIQKQGLFWISYPIKLDIPYPTLDMGFEDSCGFERVFPLYLLNPSKPNHIKCAFGESFLKKARPWGAAPNPALAAGQGCRGKTNPCTPTRSFGSFRRRQGAFAAYPQSLRSLRYSTSP